MSVKPIPEGYPRIIPAAGIRGADKAIEFYQRVFDAKAGMVMKGPDGKVAHCEMRIGDSVFMFGEPMEDGPTIMRLMVYVSDCDAVFKKAVDSGEQVKRPLTDQFYGDRTGTVIDPFGNEWTIASHKEDVSPAEMERRMKAMMSKPA